MILQLANMYYQMEVKFFYEQILLNLLRGEKKREKKGYYSY